MGNKSAVVVDFLRRLAEPAGGRESTDKELLHRFAAFGDQHAFTTVVQRHGALVLNVCRRLLRHEQDAEDAFQAAFLVLARKASQVSWSDSIICWLHEVAWRTAAELRGRRARAVQRETTMPEPPDMPAPAQEAWAELSGLIDTELRRLPDKYRAPLVLCYLEGRTRDEAAEVLGWSMGAVKGRLERGRELLRRRLVRRGITLGSGLAVVLPAGLAQGAPTRFLIGQAVALALGTPARESMTVIVAEAVLAGLASRKLAFWAAAFVLLLAGAVGAAAVYWDNEPASSLQPAVVATRSDPPREPQPPPLKKIVGLDVALGREMLHSAGVECLAVTSDGRRLLSAAFNDGFTLFDADSGALLHRWNRKGPSTIVAVAPDERMVAAATIAGDVYLFDLESREQRAFWQVKRGNLFGLAFSPDSRVLAAASADGSVALFNADDGVHLRDLAAAKGKARCMRFLPGGNVLAVGGEDGFVRLWDWQAGKELDAFAAHSKFVMSMAASIDGLLLVTCGMDNTVCLWDLRDKQQLLSLTVDQLPSTVAISPDGQILAAGNRNVIRFWHSSDGTFLHDLNAHQGGWTWSIAFSPDGRRLFSAGSDKKLKVWELESTLAP